MSVCFILPGCFATSQGYSDLRGEIASLRTVISQMQSNQADLGVTMQELNGSMIALTEKLDVSKENTSLLAQKMDDMESNFNARMDNLSVQLSGQPQKQQPAPSHIYDIAYNDYVKNHLELASVGFRNYLSRYPQGELAEKAQYYLAETLYKLKDNANALDAYEKFIRLYPRSQFVQSAKKNYNELLGLKPDKKKDEENKPVKKDEGSQLKDGKQKEENKKPQTAEPKPDPKPAEKRKPAIQISPESGSR